MTVIEKTPDRATDLLATLTGYPIFEPNQLLSYSELNDVRQYLDEQTRLSRLCLGGAGIVCGFVPITRGNSLEFTGGCGVTSLGFLIHLDSCTLTHYSPAQIRVDAFSEIDDPDNQHITAWELWESDEEGRVELTSAFFKDKVAAILLECNDEKNESCLDDCDAKGTERAFTVRKLLLKQGDAESIAQNNFKPVADDERRRYPDWSLEDLLTGRFGLEDIYLERFGYTTEDKTPQVKLTNITGYEEFLKHYATIIEKGASRATAALKQTHKALSPLFSGEHYSALPEIPKDRFDVAAIRDLDIQYVYDHLNDLILAYREFRQVAFDVMNVCCLQTGWFPKHLLLGEPVNGSAGLAIPPSTVRTPFVQPPVYNGNGWRVDAARRLFERLNVLTRTFRVPKTKPEESIRITPSRWGTAPLSERALPFYYEAKKLHQYWNPDKHRKARDHRQHSYERLGSPDSQTNHPYDLPLAFDLEPHDFYRIEGHVGHELHAAFDEIDDLRRFNNLAFDIVAVKLGKHDEKEFRHDCEFQILQTQYTKLSTDLRCALEREFPQPNETVKRLMATLVKKLDRFDYKAFARLFREVGKISGSEFGCVAGHSLEAFTVLWELHANRRKQVIDQTLFHEFAKTHPGLEHKAGVPRGGTFVLVYRDEEREQGEGASFLAGVPNEFHARILRTVEEEKFLKTRKRVVADFCLPYLCCVSCPPVAYVVARPRPTFLINKMTFCANDSDEYDFVVDPPGGFVFGPGTDRDGARYFFVPSKTNITEGPVTVTYTVDGAEASLVLQILPVPNAAFEEIGSRICNNAQIPLRAADGAAPGGRYWTDIDENNDQIGIVEDNGGFFLLAHADGVPVDTPFRVFRSVTGDNKCTGVSQQEVVVMPRVDADFTGLRGHYCQNDEPSLLKPVDQKLAESEFAGEGLKANEFIPSNVEFEEFSRDIEIAHTATSEEGCKSKVIKNTTVFRSIPGRFKPGQPRKTKESFVFPITSILPEQKEPGPLRYLFTWTDQSGTEREVLRETSRDFPLVAPQKLVGDLMELVIVLRVLNGKCAGDELRDSVPVPHVADIEPEVEDVLVKERLKLFRARVARLAEEEAELDQTKTFRLAEELVAADPDADSKAIVDKFSEFMNTLARGYSQIEGEDRRRAYRSLAEVSAEVMLDRVAVKPPADRMQREAARQLSRLAELEIDTARIRDEWLRSDLSASLDEDRVGVVRRLIE